MFKSLKIGMLGMTLFAFLSSAELCAASKASYRQKSCLAKSCGVKSYSKKAPCAGYGKPSKANGRSKCKIVSGHTKKTNNGYTYVNPYARSK